MSREITMGNLFSGSGTWELAAKMLGIKVVFEAEIEPFPVAVEAKRFPEAIQLGDVTKINGADVPAVDIFTNSSPCKDLSVSKMKREGLSGKDSKLFMEAIRITKEMRQADELRQLRVRGADEPVRHSSVRFWCWENVPGALSSNGGEDYRALLEQVARLVNERVVIPKPQRGGWSNAGVVDGNGWQIAWRIVDAKHYGIPQRRRRLFLVADLDGHSAAEVLFEKQGINWDFAEINSAWKAASRNLEDRINDAGRVVERGVRAGKRDVDEGNVGDKDLLYFESHPHDSRVTGPYNIAMTLSAKYGTGGNNTPLILEVNDTIYNKNRNERWEEEDVAMTLTARFGTGGNNTPLVLDDQKRLYNRSRVEQYDEEDVAMTLTDKLECKGGNAPLVPLVRRLMPTECARLNGFPDDWCSDIKHTDAAEYIMWGNGIALPCLLPMMKAMRDILNKEES